MYWNRDRRYRDGGFWRCAVKKRAQNAVHYEEANERILQASRDRYDADPVYRIGKLLANSRRNRRKLLQRRREALDG